LKKVEYQVPNGIGKASINMRIKLTQFGWKFRLLRFLFACTLSITSNAPSWALAQATDGSWAVPINLSHSGIASNPAFVIDSEEVMHVVWQDNLANYVYTRSEGNQWSAPKTTNLDRLFRLPLASEIVGPQLANYTGPNPFFIAGLDKDIFAFWLTPEGRLLTSSVGNQNFGDVGAWNSERLLTMEASSFAVAIDARGELHLAYFHTVQDATTPAGIYYTHSDITGRNWEIPELLYESPYLSRLGAGEANLSVATGGTAEAPRVYIAWDNRPRKQVFRAQSADGGESWEEPELIAGPTLTSGSGGPFNIRVGTYQNSVVLVWQLGQADDTCIQVYQSSGDAGATWNDPQPMIEELVGCAQSNEFVKGLANNSGDAFFLLTESKNQVFLTSWNGDQWSQPQLQRTLSGFQETEIYTDVIYACHRASMSARTMYIVGCDLGGGGDVWITSRDMGENASWFSSPVWSRPSPITNDLRKVEAIELAATNDNLIHAFFSQNQDPAIHYTYWNGEVWSSTIPVLEMPEGSAGSPVIATGPENELFLIAPSNRGVLYFSRATSGNAAIKSRWSTPARLGIGHDGEIGAADIAWDVTGTITIAYSVPVNEERGIYLVQSQDQGATWSEPLQVFDGAAAGFALVGAPFLRTSPDGFLHLIWREQSIQGEGTTQPHSLYYTRSEDGGRTFSEAEMVDDEPVAWREIIADGEGNLHLFWQLQDSVSTIWNQVSSDKGRSWQFPQGLPEEGTTATVVGDSAGRLHLVDAGPGSLSYWLWNGNRWQSDTPFHWSLDGQQVDSVEMAAAAVNKEGNMVVVLTALTGTGSTQEEILLFFTRTLKLPPNQTTNLDSLTSTPLPPVVTTETPVSASSATPVSTVYSSSPTPAVKTDRNETNNGISPIILALFPVALLLLSVLGIVIRRVIKVKDR
jgi:hypothetical protein